ncbi:MAG: putative zinc-binding metallopeptidase [Pseudoclavibacter sp.]
MRLFSCPECGRLLHFEDSRCSVCGQGVGYSRDRHTLVPVVDGTWTDPDGERHPVCVNANNGCNWIAAAPDGQCFACRLTRYLPDQLDERGTELLVQTAAAKRRLIFQLDELRLPIVSFQERPVGGLAFDLDESTDDKRVMIGHMNGVITIDITEAEDSHREALRAQLDEPYRTMLGHFRHEIGHYYWQVLVDPHEDWLQRFRTLFGDERQDYGAALDAHYGEDGGNVDWHEHFISQYATTHPWEDFAETFAHFLHIADTLQTAAAHGLELHLPASWPAAIREEHTSVPREDIDASSDLDAFLQTWEPLAEALNEVNQSMGKRPLYPFAIADAVRPKLAFILDLVRTFGAPPLSRARKSAAPVA